MEKNLIDIIAKSGIVGAGGAGFPTHVNMLRQILRLQKQQKA